MKNVVKNPTGLLKVYYMWYIFFWMGLIFQTKEIYVLIL